MLNFESLRAPPNDGDVLIEPPASELRRLAADAVHHWAAMPGGIGGVPWVALRGAVRQRLGVPVDAPLIVTGHQPEFMHPGVWAKYVVADRLAVAIGGVALNLVVDNDVPKTTAVAMPVISGDRLSLEQVPFARPGAGTPYECIPRADSAVIAAARQRFAAIMGAAFNASALPAFLEGFAGEGSRDFVEQMVAGRAAVDRAFDVAVRDVRVSAAWGGAMLLDWVLRARDFAQSYNRALAEYRREAAVRGPNRPLPDLRMAGSRVELPVWAYDADGPRRRVFVERDEGQIRLFAEDELIGRAAVADLGREGAVPDVLQAACRMKLRPRALALTLWARLVAGDLFIHGIGGAKYDRITDKIIRSYYGVEPPPMACVSATLVFWPGRTPVSRGEIASARRWVRDVIYQPDRWAAGTAGAAPLLAERCAAIARSNALREAACGSDRRGERREVFRRIRDLNARIVGLRPGIVDEARTALEQLEQRARDDRIAGSRERFFAMFPLSRLAGLCRELTDRIAG